MSYKPRTSLELNLFHIELKFKQLEKKEISLVECGLNKRFNILLKQSKPWYDDLYPKYIKLAKNLNKK